MRSPAVASQRLRSAEVAAQQALETAMAAADVGTAVEC